MKILLYAPPSDKLRKLAIQLTYDGYSVQNPADVKLAGEADERRMRKALARTMREVHAVVLIPGELAAGQALLVQVWCHMSGVPCISYTSLPPVAPDDPRDFWPLDLGQQAAEKLTANTALLAVPEPPKTLGQHVNSLLADGRARLLTVYLKANQAEDRFNQRHGWWLTNGRKAHSRYRPDPPISTTG